MVLEFPDEYICKGTSSSKVCFVFFAFTSRHSLPFISRSKLYQEKNTISQRNEILLNEIRLRLRKFRKIKVKYQLNEFI